jgi:REP element-mobilizing transposase RayT
MASRKIISKSGLYFTTFTCNSWLPLIDMINGYDIVYNWFDILKINGHDICGYVTMPNHIHLLMNFLSSRQSLNTIIGNGKRFMAYEIVQRLKIQKKAKTLFKLMDSLESSERKKGAKHKVWIDSFDAKQCRTEKFVMQKLSYIHNNPCSGKWNLASEIIDYPHSSAYFYICCKQGVYPVKDYREFLKYEEWIDE